MPPQHSTEGLEAAAQIRREFPEIGVLVLSAHAEVEQAMDLIASGRRVGYLLKSRVVDIESFIETVERIVAGGSVVDPALVQELVSSRRKHNPLDALTEREREVLSLMAEGYSNAGMGRAPPVRCRGNGRKTRARSILSKLQLPETHKTTTAGSWPSSPFSKAGEGTSPADCPPSPRAERIAVPDNSPFDKKPTAGLAVTSSSRSRWAYVDMRTIGAGAVPAPSLSRCAKSNPLSFARYTSTKDHVGS